MSTLLTLRTTLRQMVADEAATVWSDADLNGILGTSIKALYPWFHVKKTGTSTAADGPMQTLPAGAKDLYYVGLRRVGSSRVQPIRNWVEGNGEVVVPKVGIAGGELVFGWHEGFSVPVNDSDLLRIPPEAEEIVLLRGQIACLESVLASRVQANRYLSLYTREQVTEQDIAVSLDSLRESLAVRLQNLIPLPAPIPPQHVAAR